MRIHNKTRYNTKDLEEILTACTGSVWYTSFAEEREWNIDYASDSMVMPDGCFVKFNKNGDERSYVKKIALLRPNKVRGLPGIIQMEMMASGAMPRDMMIELLARLIAIKDFDRCSYRRSKAIPCTDDARRYTYVTQKATQILENNPHLQLRFSEQEVPSVALNMRRIYAAMFDNVVRCSKELDGLKYKLGRDEDRVRWVQTELEKLKGQIEDTRVKRMQADLDLKKAQEELDGYILEMNRNNVTP